MKLTWFGGESFRIYLGGKIVLVRNGPLPSGVDSTEAGAGADHQIDLTDTALSPFNSSDLGHAPTRLIDQTTEPALQMSSFADGACLIAPDEPALFIAPSADAEWGRFADNAVIIFTGENPVASARSIFATARPKLLALAVPDIIATDFATIATAADRSAVQVLEPGMALEA